MNIFAAWREKLDAWEERAEPFLGKYFFLFGPPLDRRAFLKAALIIMTVHRAVSFMLVTGLEWLWEPPVNGAGAELWGFVAVLVCSVFVVPFAVILYRRLRGMGISFPLMGYAVVIGLMFSWEYIPGDFYWSPYQIAFQLGIVLLLSFTTRWEARDDATTPSDAPPAG